jgi:DNA (cytosine-5)-methyltransferase 1
MDRAESQYITEPFESLIIPEATKQGYALASDGDGVYINRPHQKRGVVQKGMNQTIKTSGNDIGVITKELKVRKLTPLECWRLMGIKDEYFWRAKNASVSNTQLYKQAGNAIVVNVLVAIFKNLY